MSMATTLPCTFRQILTLICLFPAPLAIAAAPHPAQWIASGATAETSAGVFDFRKIIALKATPRRCVVDVSADNRFQLYVNGRRVGEGPARGDLQHWRYEEFDIAPLLHKGDNVIAARVWNFGDQAPAAQISLRTGFLLWSADDKESALNTDATWQVRAEQAWQYEPTGPPLHSLTGPVEIVDGSKYDWLWTDVRDTASWSQTFVIATPQFQQRR